jgi:hypothetical protein
VGCCELWASLGRHGQGLAEVGMSGWVSLIRWEWVMFLVVGYGYVYWSRGGCGQIWVWVGVGKFGRI